MSSGGEGASNRTASDAPVAVDVDTCQLGGVRPFHPKLTCLTLLSEAQIRSRDTLDWRGEEPLVLHRVVGENRNVCASKTIAFHANKCNHGLSTSGTNLLLCRHCTRNSVRCVRHGRFPTPVGKQEPAIDVSACAVSERETHENSVFSQKSQEGLQRKTSDARVAEQFWLI